MAIVLVTTNTHKIAETKGCLALLGLTIPVFGIQPASPVDETGSTFLENAHLKLNAGLQATLPPQARWLVAEDSGLIIDALDGYMDLSPFPGVQSDRWLNEAAQQSLLGAVYPHLNYSHKNQAILTLMQNQTSRQARYVACLAMYHIQTKQTHFFSGETPLTVAHTACGQNGFGYDPIMIPNTPNDTRTMAERTEQEKNRLSHRYFAWQQWANTDVNKCNIAQLN